MRSSSATRLSTRLTSTLTWQSESVVWSFRIFLFQVFSFDNALLSSLPLFPRRHILVSKVHRISHSGRRKGMRTLKSLRGPESESGTSGGMLLRSEEDASGTVHINMDPDESRMRHEPRRITFANDRTPLLRNPTFQSETDGDVFD